MGCNSKVMNASMHQLLEQNNMNIMLFGSLLYLHFYATVTYVLK